MREPVVIFTNDEYQAMVTLVKDALIDISTPDLSEYRRSSAEDRLERALRYLYGTHEVLD